MSCTLCWKCKNAVSGCPWSRDFKPVKDWIAIPTKIKSSFLDGSQKLVDSFIVVSCPMFKTEVNFRIEAVCKKLDISTRTYYRWCAKNIINAKGEVLNAVHVQRYRSNKRQRKRRT